MSNQPNNPPPHEGDHSVNIESQEASANANVNKDQQNLPIKKEPSKLQKFISLLVAKIFNKSFGFGFAIFLLFSTVAYSNLYATSTAKIDNWQPVTYVSMAVPDQIIYDRFMTDEANLNTTIKIPHLNDTAGFLQANGFLERADLTVIVGESGIGKSIAFIEYAKKLRKENRPVHYYSLDEKKDFHFESFSKDIFGTTDRTNFSKVLNKLPSKATLIIDNIQLAKYPEDGTLHKELFTFLNGYLMQMLGLRIIMLSSQNRVAYEIESGKKHNTKSIIFINLF